MASSSATASIAVARHAIVFAVAFGALAWLGLLLREPRVLRAILLQP